MVSPGPGLIFKIVHAALRPTVGRTSEPALDGAIHRALLNDAHDPRWLEAPGIDADGLGGLLKLLLHTLGQGLDVDRLGQEGDVRFAFQQV